MLREDIPGCLAELQRDPAKGIPAVAGIFPNGVPSCETKAEQGMGVGLFPLPTRGPYTMTTSRDEASSSIAWNFVAGIRAAIVPACRHFLNVRRTVGNHARAANCWLPACPQHRFCHQGRANADFGHPCDGRNVTPEICRENGSDVACAGEAAHASLGARQSRFHADTGNKMPLAAGLSQLTNFGPVDISTRNRKKSDLGC
ncbi:hypothetical protein RFM26_31965 [Mesorhizobium sp. VK23B]|uniref:Uncharacterized protein n=1 Tax=Mesorhizobium dulcispinae TaxID=3072316 RepID=A0ABU4XSK8_9HYPH|nr:MULTISPECIES: hypothetical protein [unclassified Mesorhizobium]MDX8470298.1 hypothetical protein [Mesorhizobium sp. VK23B]MDX8476647.1 hypothetical protein [Mesorhizobium sp. VK23A]